MTANKRINLWIVDDEVERDALSSDNGVAVGDFCIVDGTNLYMADAVSATASDWTAMAGSAEIGGPVAVGGRNFHPTASRQIFANVGIMYRAVIDDVPSTISLSPYSSLDWPTANFTTVPLSTLGFFVFGLSSAVTSNSTAWWRGTYSIIY